MVAIPICRFKPEHIEMKGMILVKYLDGPAYHDLRCAQNL